MSRASASSGGQATAMQFLSVDNAGRFALQPDAIRVLSQIKGKICPVVVCGVYRSGKSTLLNLLLDANVKSGSAFAVGGTVQACTKGMWMWTAPVIVDDRAYVFFDSEGLGSTDQHAQFDVQLFSLCLLLSSLFVLNSTGSITETSLEQLELVVQLTERIKIGQASSSSGGKDGAGGSGGRSSLQSLSAFFPSFLWVLRDFTLELRNAAGATLTPTEYLEDSLRPVPVGPNAKRGAAEKNRIRQAIAAVFHTRECVTLVRPVTEERDLQRVSSLGPSVLRPEFREQIAHLKQLIPQLAQPKSIDGITLTGKAFVALAQSYVNSINAGSVPTIRTAFASVQEIQGREAMDEAWTQVQEAVRNQIDAKGEGHVLSEEALNNALESIQTSALRLIREQALGSEADVSRLEQLFLSKHLSGLFASLRERNSHRAEKHCSAIVEDLWAQAGIEAHLPEYTSYEQLNKDVSGFWAQYLKLTKKMGNEHAAREVGRTFLDRQREKMFRMLFQRLAAATQHQLELRQANEANQAVVGKLTAELAQVRSDLQVSERTGKLELQAAQKEAQRLARELDAATKRLQAQEAQLLADRAQGADAVRQQAALVAQLESQLSARASDQTVLERQLASKSAQLDTVTQSLTSANAHTAESARKLAELKAELAATKAEQVRESKRLQNALSAAEAAAAAGNQKLSADFDAQAAQLSAATMEIASLKAEAAKSARKMQQQLATQQELQAQLQQARQNAAPAAASSDNPLGLPAPTDGPLVSRTSLLPTKFTSSNRSSSSSGGGAAAPGGPNTGSKRKSSSARSSLAEEEDDEYAVTQDDDDAHMAAGGDAYPDEEDSEDDEPPAAAAAAPAPSRAKKAAPAAAAGGSTSSSAASSGGVLRDPQSMTINELKSWLTSLDVSFPQKAQPKAWYVDLAYKSVPGLEEQFPKAKKAKK